MKNWTTKRNILLVMAIGLFSITGHARTKTEYGREVCFRVRKACHAHLANLKRIPQSNQKIKIFGQCKTANRPNCKVTLRPGFQIKYRLKSKQTFGLAFRINYTEGFRPNGWRETKLINKREVRKACEDTAKALRSHSTSYLKVRANCTYKPRNLYSSGWSEPNFQGDFTIEMD